MYDNVTMKVVEGDQVRWHHVADRVFAYQLAGIIIDGNPHVRCVTVGGGDNEQVFVQKVEA